MVIRDMFNNVEETDEIEAALRILECLEGADVHVPSSFVKMLAGHFAYINKDRFLNREARTKPRADFKAPWCRETQFRDHIPGIEMFRTVKI